MKKPPKPYQIVTVGPVETHDLIWEPETEQWMPVSMDFEVARPVGVFKGIARKFGAKRFDGKLKV